MTKDMEQVDGYLRVASRSFGDDIGTELPLYLGAAYVLNPWRDIPQPIIHALRPILKRKG